MAMPFGKRFKAISTRKSKRLESEMSIFPLSSRCRFFRKKKITSPALLQNVQLSPEVETNSSLKRWS